MKILLVNKADQTKNVEVTEEDLERFKQNYGIEYLYTSAKTGSNVDKSFLQMTQQLISTRDKDEEPISAKYSSQRSEYNQKTQLFKENRASDEKACCGN